MQTPCAKTTSRNSIANRGLLSLELGSRSQARGRQGEKASTVVSGGSWNGQEMPTGDKRGVGVCEQVPSSLADTQDIRKHRSASA